MRHQINWGKLGRISLRIFCVVSAGWYIAITILIALGHISLSTEAAINTCINCALLSALVALEA